ncbi:MAG: GAF domain-containing protein [Sideroxydans sp.]|nr:GAF domain-containing protein [Sideroxydans sp.]
MTNKNTHPDGYQALLQNIVEGVPIRIFWKDRNLRYLGSNTLFAQDAGLAGPDELIGKTDFEMGWKAQAEAYRADDMRVIESGIPQLGFEEPQTAPDGRTVWLRTSKVPLRDGEQNIIGILGIYEDITAHKLAEQNRLRLTRALRLLSKCNMVLVHAVSEQGLLDEICRLIVETGGYRMVWVGFAEQDAARSVRPVAQSGFEEGYLDKANITWADTERGRGPTGTAIRTGLPQVNHDFANNPALVPWRADALRRGYQSSSSLPLKDAAGTFGALTIYSPEHPAFNADEMELLEELAGDLAFGIVSLRMRKAHDELMRKVAQGFAATTQAISTTVEMRDPYTAGHQRRVAALVVAIARELGLPEDEIRGIELASLVHDIGKIQIPAEILSKPSRLNEIEYALIKEHAQAGYEILKGIDFPWPIAQVILQHHERLDGSGYPNGLRGEEILLWARIIAVADTIEAMSSHRPYRPGLGVQAALEEIERNRGVLFDRNVADTALRLFREQGFVLDNLPGI